MRIKKSINSPWGISIGTAVFSILFTVFMDIIFSKPVLSTLLILSRNIWRVFLTVLKFELTLGWLVLIIAVIIIVLHIIFKVIKVAPASAPFLDYKSDTFKTWKWSWEWELAYNKKWRVANLIAYCPKCGHSLLKSKDLINDCSFQCPMCNFVSIRELEEHPVKIEQLIIDKVKQRQV